ncbi:MAG: ABC transporter permease [Acidimicrobiales bacterium]|nr:MAG: ABC transporter permease [Acidimicrobiales bacterium]
MSSWHQLRTPVRWMILAAVGVLALSLLEFVTDNHGLTTEGQVGAMLRWAAPIMLAGLGGLFAERAGVVNIGLDGMMIIGMWFGAWGTVNYGPWAGLAIGILGGALAALVHAIATVSFGVDQIISGVAVLIAAPAVTRYLSLEIFDDYEGGSITQSPRLDSAGKFTFPFLSGGDLFGWTTPDTLGWFNERNWFAISDLTEVARGLTFNLSIFTVVAYALIPFLSFVIWRTRFGLRVRICGEHPTAGETQGINIYAYKYAAVIISGALAGFGGAFIATPELGGIYQEGSTNSMGFIGLSALIVGNWRPAGVMAGALLFGFPRALGLREVGDANSTHLLLLVAGLILVAVAVNNAAKRNWTDTILAGGIGLGSLIWYFTSDSVADWFVDILPFVTVLLVLTFFSQRLRMPATAGLPYRKGES